MKGSPSRRSRTGRSPAAPGAQAQQQGTHHAQPGAGRETSQQSAAGDAYRPCGDEHTALAQTAFCQQKHVPAAPGVEQGVSQGAHHQGGPSPPKGGQKPGKGNQQTASNGPQTRQEPVAQGAGQGLQSKGQQVVPKDSRSCGAWGVGNEHAHHEKGAGEIHPKVGPGPGRQQGSPSAPGGKPAGHRFSSPKRAL